MRAYVLCDLTQVMTVIKKFSFAGAEWDIPALILWLTSHSTAGDVKGGGVCGRGGAAGEMTVFVYLLTHHGVGHIRPNGQPRGEGVQQLGVHLFIAAACFTLSIT